MKQYYSITEMVELGFSRENLNELVHCKARDRFAIRSGLKKQSPWLIDKNKLVEYLKEVHTRR